MPSLWDLVKYRSTVEDGTTYEHLTSELGNPIVVASTISADIDTSPITADILIQSLEADILVEIQADIEDSSLSAEVVNQPLTADVVDLI